MKTVADQITKAKIQLILNQPFFATLALGMKFEECTEIETGDIDGETLRYNPEWVAKQTLQKTVGFIAHEVSHVAFLHHTRQGAREAKKWNIAADYAINHILKDAGLELPEGGFLNPAYANMSAEEIYSKLPDQPNDGKGNGNSNGKGNDPGGNGGVRQAPGKTKTEIQHKEAQAKQLASQAAMVAKRKGKLPAHLERLITEVLEPIVNWNDVLNQFLTEIAKNDYTFSYPSKRYLSQGLYLPSLRSIERGKFCLVVDTSGSVDFKLLNDFGAEMQSILSDVAENITVMFVDAKLQRIQEFERDEEMKLMPKGGGGTDFRPAFDKIEKEGFECSALVYFTDGCCNSFPVDPGFPVLWAIYDNKNFVAPFGEIIHIR